MEFRRQQIDDRLDGRIDRFAAQHGSDCQDKNREVDQIQPQPECHRHRGDSHGEMNPRIPLRLNGVHQPGPGVRNTLPETGLFHCSTFRAANSFRVLTGDLATCSEIGRFEWPNGF